ncbi:MULTISPECIES: succinate dehydrogenase [unclassified Cyanobium]|uniref:succinate dehydrogenase n=1 Tax=unclassified Cyanobium TaxID=2627006 RepID=UPI0020CD20FB|nr:MULTISPECIES: succinate dehydrogenase [unclassified Cyanobium]MCP9834305.1 succinate dehydrogenase [Cyanobium sp. La Preciosa 7G6]MCP9937059.1 succinate dehydrogenase [Cyanobium sp. Aljojuca 7A6]
MIVGFWIAATGLALVLFLTIHLGGVGMALVNPTGFERYATSLHQQAWLPWLEVALLAAGLGHPLLSLHRARANRQARGPAAGPLRSRRQGPSETLAALAAQLTPWSGSLLLLFLALHLAQLRWQRPADGAELAGVLAVLQAPWWLALYAVAGAAAGLHLLHGAESAVRRLGWLEPANAAVLRLVGRGLALLLGAGFALLPFALVLRSAGPLLAGG